MTKSEALIGYTGFVGSNINSQHNFDFLYDAENIEEIVGKKFDLIVCAGAPGVKWLANKESKKDMSSIKRLIDALSKVKSRKFVLISTIDIYPKPAGVNESSLVNKDNLSPYGRHRRILEEFVMDNFDYTIVRLPGVFGKGLKKNIIYDFMNNIHKPVHKDSIFQFYYLDYIWKDITISLRNNISFINFATEPISMNELEREIFGYNFFPYTTGVAPYYDMQTKYSHLWGGNGRYLYSKDSILSDLKLFIRSPDLS